MDVGINFTPNMERLSMLIDLDSHFHALSVYGTKRMTTELTPGIYQLTLPDGTPRSVRVSDVSGELRCWFVDAAGIKCADCDTMLVTDDMVLTRSPEQEKIDLSQAVVSSLDDALSQVTRLAEIARKSAEKLDWNAVMELLKITNAIQQLIEEL